METGLVARTATDARGGAIRNYADAPPPVEQLSSIHDGAINDLRDASYALDQLLSKVRGSQPSKDSGQVEKIPERHLLSDAYVIRSLATGISNRVTELHRVIGHEK